MDLTLTELLTLIDALEAEFAVARADGDSSKMAELQAAFQVLRSLRAQAVIEMADILTTDIRSRTDTVGRGILRLTDARTIITLRGLSDRTAIGVPPAPKPTRRQRPSTEEMPDVPPVVELDRPGSAAVGGPSRYITARRTAQLTVVYIDDEGRDFIRIGGSRSWRNNNPGNIRKGNFADSNGAIGDDGSFAIFPDKPTGLKAVELLLRGASYARLTIENGIHRYAPPQENDTDHYLRFVLERTGLNASDSLGQLPVADLRRIVRAIEEMEGWREGEERAHQPSSGRIVDATSGTSAGVGAATEWMDVARREEALSIREIAGSRDNPRILEYFRVASPWSEPDGDETAWCAAFVNYCLETSGHVGTNHPGARSFFWNKKRQFVSLPGPRKFAIAVLRNAPFDDDEWTVGTGHVGFIVDYTDTHLTLLGGNQGNAVQESVYPRVKKNRAGQIVAQFVAFMMPVID